MKKGINILIIILVTVITYSCTEDKGVYFEKILNSKTKHLRGAKVGDNIDHVKSLEEAKFILDDMEDYLHYDYELDMGNSYTVTYDFSENSLYETEISVYFDKIDDAKILSQDFLNFFNEKYGKGDLELDGYMNWTTTSSEKNIEFALKEDSEKYGFVSIKMRDLDY